MPSAGGTFTITLFHASAPASSRTTPVEPGGISSESGRTDEAVVVQETLLWDRKTDGGFPETKELKSRVRNVVAPGRDLGHVDRSLKKGKGEGQEKGVAASVDEPSKVIVAKGNEETAQVNAVGGQEDCKDCA